MEQALFKVEIGKIPTFSQRQLQKFFVIHGKQKYKKSVTFTCTIYRNPKHLNFTIMKKYECNLCGYVYDPAEGDPDNGIAPGTAFEDLPDDWVCPLCGAGKEDFSPL